MDSIYLSDEHLLLRNMVRDFASNELAPIAQEIDQNSTFPIESIKKISDLGLMGIPWPSKYNGGEMDTISLVIAIKDVVIIMIYIFKWMYASPLLN